MVNLGADEYSLKCTFASLPRTQRAMPLVLSASPDSTKFMYCNGNSVYIRNVADPSQCELYTEHSVPTTVAQYAPSGYYIASGDSSGKVRVWDTTQSTHILKAEYGIINGPIKDISWSPDSKRLAVVGDGKERFGHVFLFDTGTSNGSLSGQSKCMNSVHFRPERPYRIVSASEDNTVALFEGPPFKFKTLFHNHTRFAHVVRYQPGTGATFASCGADGKVFLYEGSEGTLTGEFVDDAIKGGNAHSGGVYGLSWSPDAKHILTASGDKTCKCSWTMGHTVDDQQLGCLCVGESQLSCSLSGSISYLDARDPGAPIRTINGHNRPITAMSVCDTNIYTADSDGNICRWNSDSGASLRLKPTIHKSQVSGVHAAGDRLVSCGWDDTAACTEGVAGHVLDKLVPQSVSLDSQPRGVSVSPDAQLTAMACQKSVLLFKDSKVRIYDLGADCGPHGCQLSKELTHQGAISAVHFSPSGKYLAVCDAARRVVPYDTSDFKSASSKDWAFHSAKVTCVAWHATERFLVTGSLDTNLIVWDLQKSGEHPIIIKGAHTMSQITAVAWLNESTVVSAGQDSNLKQWTVKLP